MSKSVTRICLHCGSNFEFSLRTGLKWAEKTGRGKYCSRLCKGQSHKGIRFSPSTEFKHTITKEDQKSKPLYKDGLWSYRRWIKDNCEDCGSVEQLHVHHVDRNRRNNELDNLKTLCKDCHWTYHRGNRTAWNKGLKTGVRNV